MGVSYEMLPYKIQNNDVTELSFSAGATLPLGQLYGKSLANQAKFINLAFRYVMRRTSGRKLDNDYWQLSASFTLNHKWFVRRKYGI